MIQRTDWAYKPTKDDRRNFYITQPIIDQYLEVENRWKEKGFKRVNRDKDIEWKWNDSNYPLQFRQKDEYDDVTQHHVHYNNQSLFIDNLIGEDGVKIDENIALDDTD